MTADKKLYWRQLAWNPRLWHMVKLVMENEGLEHPDEALERVFEYYVVGTHLQTGEATTKSSNSRLPSGTAGKPKPAEVETNNG